MVTTFPAPSHNPEVQREPGDRATGNFNGGQRRSEAAIASDANDNDDRQSTESRYFTVVASRTGLLTTPGMNTDSAPSSRQPTPRLDDHFSDQVKFRSKESDGQHGRQQGADKTATTLGSVTARCSQSDRRVGMYTLAEVSPNLATKTDAYLLDINWRPLPSLLSQSLN